MSLENTNVWTLFVPPHVLLQTPTPCIASTWVHLRTGSLSSVFFMFDTRADIFNLENKCIPNWFMAFFDGANTAHRKLILLAEELCDSLAQKHEFVYANSMEKSFSSESSSR